MTATPQHHRRAALVASAAAIVFSACGGAATAPIPEAVGQAAPSAPAEQSIADAVLTTVPPLAERYPDLFDERGCALGPDTPAFTELSPESQAAIKAALPAEALAQLESNGEIDLDAMAPEVLGAMLEAEGVETVDCNISGETPADPREFYGYLGPNAERFSPGQVEARAVVDLDGNWGAIGYAVAPADGGTVTITATLNDSNGTTITSISAESPVRGARPDEPLAFALASEVTANKVASVEYSVSETAAVANRGLSILVEGVIADDDRSVVIGTITNSSDVAAVDPGGVVAISEAGAPTVVVEFTVTEPGTTRAIDRLEPGFSGTFEVIVDDPAHAVTSDSIEVWAFAS